MREITINEKNNAKKLNTVLFWYFNGLTSNTFYKALRKKDIRVNGTRIHENITVVTGDVICVYLVDELLFKSTASNLCIVYEDENILLLNKPCGIEVTDSDDSLTSVLQKQYPFIQPCHRIDRNTTGLVIFAKNKETETILLQKFKLQEIDKHYACLVYGIPKPAKQTCTAYLFKDAKKSIVYISDVVKKGYVEIVTSYSILEKQEEQNASILDVTLHTGRTHQIRAHLAHLGYPIIGDGKYGDNAINKKWKQKTQYLCAYRLHFKFTTDNGILDYLKDKEFSIPYSFS